ncbi:chromosome partitioning protein ParB [Deinococcus cavernae]|uniref:Chromosome partitioning protein ParB n=1 Tax=Deinococcus cavernae TaxID=2320857 RepID=A0A418VEC7_9DEIO|nr:DNA methyltransferase [Deinococcus cavernae]RJF74445.1 chromosome partitioning protein ParB [Deinococcus cavernae]
MTAQLLNDRAVMEPLDTLTLHPRNPNRADVQEIAESIRTVGWYGVLIAQVSTRYILKGNHSAQGAREAGLTHVPVFWVDVDDATAYKILLGDNEYAAHGVRDREALLALLQELHDGGHGLTGTGFTPATFQDLLQELQGEVEHDLLTDEDDVPALSEQTVTRPGDLWSLGPHRVQCGDSTNAAHLARLMGGVQARLTVTDPPYNVAYEGKTKDRLKIANDAMTPEEFAVFIKSAMQATASVMPPGACIYVFYAEVESVAFHGGLRAGGFKYSQTLVWVKNAANMSRQDYNWRHEPALYGWKEGAGHYYGQDFTQTTVIDDSADLSKLSKDELLSLLRQTRDASTVIYEKKPVRNDIHPTMKPTALYCRFLINSSQPGWPVLDPFGGSGTLLIAAHKHGRVAYLNELGPNYVDQIIRRAQAATGLKAVRQDGVAFDDLEPQRT